MSTCCIAVCFVDLLRHCGAMSVEEADELIGDGLASTRGSFVLGSQGRSFYWASIRPNAVVLLLAQAAHVHRCIKLFSTASDKIFTCSAKHDTCAKPAVPRHEHPRTRPSVYFFQWRVCVNKSTALYRVSCMLVTSR